MYDVIGRPARFGDIIFVPILGDYEFGAPYSYLEDQPCSFSIPQIVVEYDIYDHNCWWTRARLIEIFAVDHPVGCNLTRVLEFLFVAVFYSPAFLTAVPVLLSEQRKDSWSPTTAALSFKSLFSGAIADRITNAFWQLLTQDSQALGVFSDYFAVGWHDARDDYDRSNAGALYKSLVTEQNLI